VGTCCADHVTPLYPQKLALTSPTGGGRSVGIVRVRTKATELATSGVITDWVLNIYVVVRRRRSAGKTSKRRDIHTYLFMYNYLFIYLYVQVVGLSVRTSAWNNSVPSGRILIKFAI